MLQCPISRPLFFQHDYEIQCNLTYGYFIDFSNQKTRLQTKSRELYTVNMYIILCQVVGDINSNNVYLFYMRHSNLSLTVNFRCIPLAPLSNWCYAADFFDLLEPSWYFVDLVSEGIINFVSFELPIHLSSSPSTRCLWPTECIDQFIGHLVQWCEGMRDCTMNQDIQVTNLELTVFCRLLSKFSTDLKNSKTCRVCRNFPFFSYSPWPPGGSNKSRKNDG